MGAAAARVAYRAMYSRPPGGARTWRRTNHRDDDVTLLEGPAAALGAAGAIAILPWIPARLRASGVLVTAASAAVGAYDDIAGSGASRGFRGHLAALRRGEVSSGVVKVAGIGAASMAAAALVRGDARDVLLDGATMAAAANLANLLDLRPGRALKAVLLATPAMLLDRGYAGDVASAPIGAALAMLPEDLGERAMLGDAGANALGALVGLAVTTRLDRGGRAAVLGGLLGLTAASEVVSFTEVIQRTPPLRFLDELGRSPGGRRRPPG